MSNNPDPEKMFRMLSHAGRAIALDDLDDMGDWPVNHNTPVPGFSSAPHHGPVGVMLMLAAEGGREVVQQTHTQPRTLEEQLSDALYE